MKNYLFAYLFILASVLAQFDSVGQNMPDFAIQVVDSQISIGYGLAIGDVDGDRKADILLADQKEIVWYRNPGYKTSPWKRYVMAANLTPQDNVCLAARDLNGDGRVEVAVGAGWNPSETSDSTKSGAVFYLIRPQDPTQRWEPVRLPHEVTTHRMRWAKVGTDSYQLVVVPLHGLGNKDGKGRGVRIWGYGFPKNPKGKWKQHLVDSTLHLTHNFEVWEDEKATGMIMASKEGGQIFRWQKDKWQPVDDESASNTLDILNKGVNGIGEIRRMDNGQRIATIQPMHGNLLQIETGFYSFREPRKPVDEKEITLITDLFNQGHALVSGDFLGLGSDQLVAGWRNPNAEGKVGVRLFKQKEPGNMEGYPLDESVGMACEDMQAADLDGDGDLDLIASGRSTHNVLIYWNGRK